MPDAPARCGAPTKADQPCARPPLGGGGGRCDQHANLPLTTRQREAAGRRALKHGYFSKEPRTEEERALKAEADAVENFGSVQERAARFHIFRAARVARWEQDQTEPSPYTVAAFEALRRALADLPTEEREPHRCLDDAAIVRRVEELLADPERLVEAFPAAKREAARRLLRDGDSHGPA